jgi:subtilisin-like proprotein convertase family protein
MCTAGGCQEGYSTLQFQVDRAGTYSFVMGYTGAGPDGFCSIHTGSFNSASVCDGFIAANWQETGGGIGPVNPMQGTFTPGVTYTMMFTHWYGNNSSSGIVTFSSSNGGNVILINQGPGAPPASDYAYTYVAVNIGTGLIAAVNADANFTTLPSGSYRVYGMSYKSANPPPAVVNPAGIVGLSLEGALATNQCLLFSKNFVNVVVTGCAAPTVNAPAVTHPPCFSSTGIITVNATGSGTLEYSVDNGATWQLGTTFTNLSPGNYHVRARLQANPTCSAGYAGNPVVLSATAAPVYASVDVPKAISPSGTPTVTSTLTISSSGVIADVNVLNLDIDHTWISDLRVKLKSPAGTERILVDRICNDQDNFLINFNDESANTYASIPCPPNNVTHQPNQTLSAFNGENAAGIWTLTVEDLSDQDGGELQAWSLQVCHNTCPTTLPVNSLPIVSGAYSAQQILTSSGMTVGNANVLFKAGTSVELTANFEVLLGTVFEVMMQGCVP